MENLFIAGSKSTPEVKFSFEDKKLQISGHSYPENSFSFYKPIIEWITDFLEHKDTETVEFLIEIKYLNTSSTKSFMNIFDMMEEAKEEGKDVIVKWFYDKDNDAIKEVAEEFKEDLNIPFEIVEV